MAISYPQETPSFKTINKFKSKLTGGGARPNLFEVILSFPGSADVDNASGVVDDARILVKAAALPASTIAPIEIPFRGRTLKIAGDRTFETWTITVINDTTFKIRSAFEKWMNYINEMNSGKGETDPTEYQKDAIVHQLDREGQILRSYYFRDIFPTNISTIDLNYETTDTIQEFTVEMQVQYWEAKKGTASTSGGQDILAGDV